ncbi:phosphoglycerate mutase [Roseovarius sp. HI0049]|nr:phosphoglycerate mutase [Roseovarius sp. HI0049]
MKRLILMRHAKSSWATPGQDDHARPLNGRGKVSARVLGEWLTHKRYLPDQTLSSDSARTRETFARLKILSDAEFLADLYLADPEDMLRVLRKATGDTVLMLGHNPGIGWFAQTLVAEPPPHPRFFDYPTCATLVAEFDIATWEEVGTGTGKAVDFVIPRELTG